MDMTGIETYYLIDYENVHGDGLAGCQNLQKTDHIVIFFTQNAKNIDMRDIKDHGTADLDMIEVPAGKQSADMHIGSYLGYLAGKKGKNCCVVIISKDNDFDNVIRFWKQKTGIVASRNEQIKKKPISKPKTSKQKSTTENMSVVEINGTKKTKLKRDIIQAMRSDGYDDSVANTVAQIATSVFGNQRMLSEVHNALKDRYTDYLEVYAVVKPVLSKYIYDN